MMELKPRKIGIADWQGKPNTMTEQERASAIRQMREDMEITMLLQAHYGLTIDECRLVLDGPDALREYRLLMLLDEREARAKQLPLPSNDSWRDRPPLL